MSKIEVKDIDTPSGESTMTIGGTHSSIIDLSATTLNIGKSGGTVSLAAGAEAFGFGNIVNVWRQSDATPITTQSTTWQDTTIDFSVTPKSASNTIVWFIESSDKGTTGQQSMLYRITLGGVQVGSDQDGGYDDTQGEMYWFRFGSAGTTSTVAGKMQVRAANAVAYNAYHYWAELLALEVTI